MTSPENIELLEYATIYTSNPNNQLRLEKMSQDSFEIKFEYIEPNDTATFQILHTGKDSSALKISGTIIGAKTPFTSPPVKDLAVITNPMGGLLKFVFRSPRIFSFIFLVILMIIFAVPTYLSFTSSNFLIGTICAFPTVVLGLGAISQLIRRKHYQRNVSVYQDMLRSVLLKTFDQENKDPSNRSKE